MDYTRKVESKMITEVCKKRNQKSPKNGDTGMWFYFPLRSLGGLWMILSIKTIENMMKIMLIVLRVSLDCFPL